MQPALACVGSIAAGMCLQAAIRERFDLKTTLGLKAGDRSVTTVGLDTDRPHDLEAVRQFAEGFAVGYNAADEQAADEAWDDFYKRGS